MASSTTAFLLVLVVACLCSCSYAGSATNVSYDGRSLIINGQRRVILSGSIHYPRSTAEMWPDLIQKSKEGGLDAIETYVFWDVHEPRRREYNFEGNLDLIKFIKAVQQAGLYCILRIGPYVCAEWNFGGFPMWLYNTPGVELRTDNEIYKNEMQIFTTLIVDMVKKENLLAGQGGPIILTQIENEYGNIQGPYGARGKAYIQWCAKMAVAQNVGVPWIMCQQGDAPQPMINTCNGFYCDSFKPNNPNVPKMWTENWTGWFKAWGGRDPHRPAEDVAYAVARFFQRGGTLQNYYMYHGGTNFGRTSGGPFITTSYDYDAPLDEYGNLRQPKWGHLKQLHEAIKSMEKVLTYGDVSGQNFSDVTEATIYTYNGNSGCFLVNKDKTNDANLNFKGKNYFVPAWSVSILPDCQQEVYNTAKIRVQTSLMEKITSDEDSTSRIWQWRPENIKGPLRGKHPSLESAQLLHQFKTTGDVSDYLWYTTSFKVDHQDPGFSKHMTLRVNTTGHVLHAFVNRRLVGSQYADQGKYKFVFEKDVNVKAGKNSITLLSVTVGLQNYGSFYENMPAGIIGGPVQLIGTGNVTTKDLSSSTWLYKIGLHGEEFQLWSDQSRHAKKWLTEDLHGNRFMTWYKTNFKTPSGTEPVVVDLIGMGKGRAWVNGQSLGRYWVTKTAPWDGCGPCNYRAVYQSENCRTGCGEPTQRWYHVPRSFLNEEKNTLVLFEEVGGNPATVSFATVTAGTICASVSTASGSGSGSPVMELACTGGRSISEIKFAGFGDAKGTCGSFQKGSCDASNTLSVVQQACAGKTSCSITVSDSTFGAENTCGNTVKTLTVQATCS